MCVLLKDAIKPNLVQTLEHTPALIHCGPFANIAHGCNSVIATKLGLKMADYVITEAGFAADLGAEKFLHIKCRQAGLKPDAVVCVLSCRAMKLHGGAELETLSDENLDALKQGFENARVHIENMGKFGLPVVVALNRFPQDSDAELNLVLDLCDEMGVRAALSEVAVNGGEGGVELAQAVLDTIDENAADYHVLYDSNDSIKEKIQTVCRDIYRAADVDYSDKALAEIAKLEAAKLDKLPLCIAKTQLSISDNAKLSGAPSGFTVKVNDVKIYHSCPMSNHRYTPSIGFSPHFNNNFQLKTLI